MAYLSRHFVDDLTIHATILYFIIGVLLCMLVIGYFMGERVLQKLRKRNQKYREVIENLVLELEQHNPNGRPLEIPGGLKQNAQQMAQSTGAMTDLFGETNPIMAQQNNDDMPQMLRGRPPVFDHNPSLMHGEVDNGDILQNIRKGVENARDNGERPVINAPTMQNTMPRVVVNEPKNLQPSNYEIQRREIGLIKNFFNQIANKVNYFSNANDAQRVDTKQQFQSQLQQSMQNINNIVVGPPNNPPMVLHETAPTLAVNPPMAQTARPTPQLFIQDIIDITTNATYYFGCYGAMVGNDGKVMNPREYMPQLISDGALGTLELKLLEQAIRHKQQNPQMTAGFIYHLSSDILKDNQFLNDLVDYLSDRILSEPGIKIPQTLMFSVQFFDMPNLPVDFLAKIQNFGFQICIEGGKITTMDINQLKSLSVGVVRCDVNDLMQLAQTTSRDEIIRAKNRLERVNIHLIAQNILNADQSNFCHNHEIQLAQGRYFNAPRKL